jgi:hypothetical protein
MLAFLGEVPEVGVPIQAMGARRANHRSTSDRSTMEDRPPRSFAKPLRPSPSDLAIRPQSCVMTDSAH